jgi:hypothetical protein
LWSAVSLKQLTTKKVNFIVEYLREYKAICKKALTSVSGAQMELQKTRGRKSRDRVFLKILNSKSKYMNKYYILVTWYNEDIVSSWKMAFRILTYIVTTKFFKFLNKASRRIWSYKLWPVNQGCRGLSLMEIVKSNNKSKCQ